VAFRSTTTAGCRAPCATPAGCEATQGTGSCATGRAGASRRARHAGWPTSRRAGYAGWPRAGRLRAGWGRGPRPRREAASRCTARGGRAGTAPRWTRRAAHRARGRARHGWPRQTPGAGATTSGCPRRGSAPALRQHARAGAARPCRRAGPGRLARPRRRPPRRCWPRLAAARWRAAPGRRGRCRGAREREGRGKGRASGVEGERGTCVGSGREKEVGGRGG
jgi:hypothetical protein